MAVRAKECDAPLYLPLANRRFQKEKGNGMREPEEGSNILHVNPLKTDRLAQRQFTLYELV